MIYIFIVLIIVGSLIPIAIIELNLKVSERKLETAIRTLELADQKIEIVINTRLNRKQIAQIKFAKSLDNLTDMNSVKTTVKELWIITKEQIQQWVQVIKNRDFKMNRNSKNES